MRMEFQRKFRLKNWASTSWSVMRLGSVQSSTWKLNESSVSPEKCGTVVEVMVAVGLPVEDGELVPVAVAVAVAVGVAVGITVSVAVPVPVAVRVKVSVSVAVAVVDWVGDRVEVLVAVAERVVVAVAVPVGEGEAVLLGVAV